MDRKIDQQMVMKHAIKTGQDPRQAWRDFKDQTGDSEMGEAALIAVKEVALFYVGGLAVKVIFRGGRYLYIAYQGSKVVRAGELTLGSFEFAGKYGVQGFNRLRAAINGTGLQAHHLLEQRFASILGMETGQMASIALTKAEHQIFTNAWRAEIGYRGSNAAVTTANATKQQIYDAARRIYANHPEILKVLGL
jgi:hypothetical protein